MLQQVETTIRNYMAEVIHLSLATSKDNKPWICEVHYSYDDDLNIYFISKPNRRHSLEIAANPQVAGNIVKEHAMGEDPRGVYFEGHAQLLYHIHEGSPAFTTYRDRFKVTEALLDELKAEDGHRFYKITVETFYVFDNKESDPGHKYELNWKK